MEELGLCALMLLCLVWKKKLHWSSDKGLSTELAAGSGKAL
jgi:hypothetical protein